MCKASAVEQDARQAGFFLVELSIVLVILGLLVGGVLGGRSLIRAAEMRAVTSEFEQWQTAVNAFKNRFAQLPGDFSKAVDFWPGQTSNGNGDGFVAPLGGSEAQEAFLFWQHLSRAGLIPGEYTGAAGPNWMWHHIPGENCPQSRLNGAGWTARFWDNEEEDSPRVFFFNYQHGFIMGLPGTISGGNMTYDPVLTPEEAWRIDSKFDDGRPARGRTHGIRVDMGCTTAVDNEDFDAEYALQDSTTRCALYFGRAF